VQRSQIIDGAYQLIINEGFKKFHARNIAQHIACSTQPIYREFANLAELKSVFNYPRFIEICRFSGRSGTKDTTSSLKSDNQLCHRLPR
jgi:hypothetical protein